MTKQLWHHRRDGGAAENRQSLVVSVGGARVKVAGKTKCLMSNYDPNNHLYDPNNHLWTHWSWTMNFTFRKAMQKQEHKQLYDVYMSAKLQGPSYVANSKQPDEARVDRIILVKVKPDEKRMDGE